VSSINILPGFICSAFISLSTAMGTRARAHECGRATTCVLTEHSIEAGGMLI
jgi:hypothetical protein